MANKDVTIGDVGKRRTVFHGSQHRFSAFNAEKIGSTLATSGGFGFYFSEDYEVAKAYANNGYMYTCTIPMNKELHFDKTTISEQELEKVLTKLDEENDILSNWGDTGWSGMKTVMKEATTQIFDNCTSDVEILGSLANVDDLSTVLRSFSEVLGYDHSVHSSNRNNKIRHDYVSLVPEQIVIESIDAVKEELVQTEHVQDIENQNQATRFFVDMDGVLAVFNNDIPSEEVLFEKGYYASLPPHENVVNAIKELDAAHPGQVHILSAVLDSEYAAEEKTAWLKEYLPQISEDRMIFSEYGKPKQDFIVGGIKESDILLDDYTKNLTAWKDAGGNAIKLVNSINDTNKSWDGHRVHYQDTQLFTSIERTIDRIQSNEPPNKQLPGELQINLQYVSGSTQLVEETIQELNERFANVQDGNLPKVKLSLRVDETVILEDEVLDKEDFVRHESDFKGKNSFSLLEVAKDKLKERILQKEDIKHEVAQYSKLAKFEEHVQEEPLAVSETIQESENLGIVLSE